MKVLFVSRSKKGSISPIVNSQGESLKDIGINVLYFGIARGGLLGYFSSIFELRRKIEQENPDIIHAHYSLCCIISAFATRKPIIASLMGSDVMGSKASMVITGFFSKHFWAHTIVKSKGMKTKSKIKVAHVIPNGVNLTNFKPLDSMESKNRVGFDPTKKQILFMANPDRYPKNFPLASSAFQMLQETLQNVELKVVHGIEHEKVVDYINAANVVLLTSRWEGSPNIIKEAMACNTPIVSTNVGDVEEIIGSTPGCYLSEPTKEDLSENLKRALAFNGRTVGRENVQVLDSVLIANKIKSLYKQILGLN